MDIIKKMKFDFKTNQYYEITKHLEKSLDDIFYFDHNKI